MNDRWKQKGRDYWRSLDELSDSPEFKDFLHREFPKGTSDWVNENNWTRRNFLTLMGASLALAGLAGCRRPVEKIVPYVTRPQEITPGEPLTYATTMPFGQSAYGLLVTSNDGRPTKLHGNPAHPSSTGSSTIFTEAAILGLYDPDRSASVRNNGDDSDWDKFVSFWQEHAATLQQNDGAGLAILSESFASPTTERLARSLQRKYPKAAWVTWDPISDENVYEGIRRATGQSLQPIYHYGAADVIVTLDADIFRFESEPIGAARGFTAGRKVDSKQDNMNRLYAVESSLSMTGAMADHRLRVKSGRIGAFLSALTRELAGQGLDIPAGKAAEGFDDTFIRVLASDLLAARGRSLVIAGYRQPAEVHQLVCVLNSALGNHAATIHYRPNGDAFLSNSTALRDLTEQLNGGKISTLVMLGGNPVYNAPADLDFVSAMKKATHTIHLSPYVDETSAAVTWHLPQAHFLESWGDARAVDGTLSVVQPMIAPLFGGVSALEVLAVLAAQDVSNGHELVQESWRENIGRGNFEDRWKQVLHDGLLANSAERTLRPGIGRSAAAEAVAAVDDLPAAKGTELGFYPSQLWDGRFANNGWLQELPDTMTKLAWDNAAVMSKTTADKLGVSTGSSYGDMVEITVDGRSLTLPVWIVPGHADDAISLPLGYGREGTGRVANKAGFNSYRLRTTDGLHFAGSISIRPIAETYPLANTQDHGSMEGRPIILESTLTGFKNGEDFHPAPPEHPPLVPLWNPHTYDTGYQWGMSIDLNSCIGCNACTIACQSENNIPVVGKEQVKNGREMQWLRIDRYYATPDVTKPDSKTEVSVQPMMCQHCEYAPCEQVCPVAATVHDSEGLNVMVYNRCIGTRYCSNNCPFKVRRFNFFNYTNDLPEVVKMAQNPQVTVRFRGVMEKCTYCIQRITRTKIKAKVAGRQVRDGEIVTACQQACPADAIVFGNINDPDSRVSKKKKNERRYHVLQDLNLRTRTSYLARLRNPHPELMDDKS